MTARKLACAAAAAAIVATFIQPAEAATARREPGGAVRFYDDNGNDRGYAWCLYRGGRWFGSWGDCSYFTLPQCREASWPPPGGYCEPNPFAAQVTPPPQRRRR